MASGMITQYICQQCGAESAKWQGQCSKCGSWNSLVEALKSKKELKAAKQASSLQHYLPEEITPTQLDNIKTDSLPRLSTGFAEFDRVLGGGLVPGSVVLIGGEPGVGKSTLLLQSILNTGGIYISAEESAHQVKSRADRMASSKMDNVLLLSTSNIDRAIASIESQEKPPALVIIDSIQTVSTDDLDGVPGSIGQVRECAHRLVRLAKTSNIPLLIVSHVTKEGTLAGPKVLEHVVDAVIYVEGQDMSLMRIIRGTKNRFGTVHEVGLFELSENGMVEITDAFQAFAPSQPLASGSVLTISMEGIRPMMLEVQALATPTSFGLPRRTANGMDYNRLLMLLAVLSKRTKLKVGSHDIYTNIAGGIKIRETALDLAVCIAVASSLLDEPLDEGIIIFGEVSLSGEIKPVVGQSKRTEQAKKLGYKKFITSETASNINQALQQARSRSK